MKFNSLVETNCEVALGDVFRAACELRRVQEPYDFAAQDAQTSEWRLSERAVPRKISPRSHFPILLILFLGFLFSSCATSYDKRGVYYKVRSGDSISRIARIYRVDVQALAEYNNLLNPDEMQSGMRLYIPPRSKRGAFKKLPFGTTIGSESVQAKKKRGRREKKYEQPVQVYRGRFEWPVEGRAGSPFGIRNGRRHDGLDIVAPSGMPIHASASGRVVFAGEMRGYGNLILIRHKDDFFTAYAHNSKNIAKKGQQVRQGEVIAEVGRTGRATAPHVHFEIRHGQTARNPLFFLPERKLAANKM